ncbi:uncharacterized protein LOC119083919 [Bradysia coprophila]|uniref:uncharacterized protein LOC119083919 n=1 Tax=Bradysia coprophila TaxID=38358 RepID=UPI00187D79D1|nr:uncharacterized protein LOC119083919 [Bradysia coprophila]
MSINQHHADETEVLSEDARNICLNAEKADVHFIFKSGDEHVPAHKSLLSRGSNVFQAMFDGPLKEEGDIEIVDATAEAFKEFLRFFYFNKVDVSMEHVSSVMCLGRKYNVADCQRLCVNSLEASITELTATVVLGLAIIYDEKQLQKSCELIIASRTDDVFKSENFLVCDRRVLEHILKMDRLACTEAELFEACMSWVRATSNEDHLTRDIVQTHLGRLFYEIRFKAMNLEEFSKLLRVYGELFSVNEYSEILRVAFGQEKNPKIFQMEQRSYDWKHAKLIVCNREILSNSVYIYQTVSVTQFSSNTRLLLRYFVVDSIFNNSDDPVQTINNVEASVIADSKDLTRFTCTLKYANEGYKKAKTMSINQHHADETEVLSEDARNICLNAEKADVHFIFKSGDERVPAHKSLLSRGSDVFQTMFDGPLKEEGDIEIVDATAEAFKEFLRFFYFNKVDVSMEHVSSVMCLGRKYNVADCQRLCVNSLEASITELTATVVLGLAIIYDEKQLQKSCELIIASRTDDVFKSENFLVCDRRVLEHILKMDRLACTEAELFEACMSWVRATSNEDHLTRDIVQTHLGRLFYEIRFGAMNLEEFSKLLRVYGELFSVNEYSEIIRVALGQEKNPKIFQMEQRSYDWKHAKLIVCNREILSNSVFFYQTVSVTQFSSNTRLLLRYFVVDSIFKHSVDPVQTIEYVEASVIADSKDLTRFTCTLKYSNEGYIVHFPYPISIRSKKFYEIRIKFPTGEFRKSNFFLSSTVEMENNVVVVFRVDKVMHDNKKSIIKSLGFNLLN